jgi:hypothetical protein
MNDPVLNRKLFRHKAQIIHNKIPKYQYGGPPQSPFTPTGFKQSLAARQAAAQAHFKNANKFKLLATALGPGKFGKGIKHAYGTYKAARAATKASGKGGTLWGTLPFTTTGKGPQSVYQKLMKPVSKHMMKHPKKYGYTKAGIGGAFTVGTGFGIADAIKKGHYGTAALEASLLPFGGAWTAKGLQLAAKGIKSKRGIGAFKKAGAVKKKLDKQKWVLPAFIGGGGTMLYRGEGEAQAYTEADADQIFKIVEKIAKDINNITQAEVDEAIKIFEADKTQKKPENLGDKGSVSENTKEMIADEKIPDAGGSTSTDAATILAKQKEKNAETQAGVLKNKFDNSDAETQREFLKFRQSITDLTGTYGNDRDLILMKMASGMMSGTTPHKGLRGFMDVTGKAMGPTVDTALALSNAQKGRDTDLATAFLKMKQEQAEADAQGMQLAGAQKRYLVKDEKSPYGYKVVMGQYNEQTGQIMEHIGNQQYRVMQGDPTEIKVSMAQLGKTQTQLGSAAMGLDYVNWVLEDMDDSLKGIKGWAKLKLADWQNLAETYEGKSNKYTQGLNTSDYVDGLLTPENIEGYNDKVEIKDWKGKVIRESTIGQEIRKQYVKEQAEIRENMAKRTSGWDINEEQLFQLTKAALIENRLKYIIANANKSEDRLTRWDIDNAAKNTGILPFITFSQGFTPETVNAKMTVLQGELIGNFNSQARKYQQQGGTNDFLLDFTSVPYIRTFLEQQETDKMNQQAVIDGLESIEIPKALKEGGLVGA